LTIHMVTRFTVRPVGLLKLSRTNELTKSRGFLGLLFWEIRDKRIASHLVSTDTAVKQMHAWEGHAFSRVHRDQRHQLSNRTKKSGWSV
jgi:hypothetical protein